MANLQIGETLGFFANLLAVPSLLLGVYLYLLAKNRTELSWSHETYRVISGEIRAISGALQVSFEGRSVERLSKTFVVIWNSGTLPLTKETFAADGWPILSVPRGSTLRVAVDSSVQRIGRSYVAVVPQDNDLERIDYKIDFEFLNPGDGFALEILHEADTTDVRLDATVIGAQPAVRFRRMERMYAAPLVGFSVGLFAALYATINVVPHEVVADAFVDAAWYIRLPGTLGLALLQLVGTLFVGVLSAVLMDRIINGRNRGIPGLLQWSLAKAALRFSRRVER
jgi:uncharacterized integral membrane protein